MWQLKMFGGLTAVGTPVIKAGKFIAKKTPKSLKKFGKKSKQFAKSEWKEMKTFPEMYAGAAVIGGGLGLGTSSAIKAMRNEKKKKYKTTKLKLGNYDYKITSYK